MGLNGILSSALTSLQTNTSALRVVSQNIANLNTQNYVRREVNLSALGANGVPQGVTIEDVTRATNQYLVQENLSATASSSQYDTLSNVYDQINALLGSPGDGTSLTSKLSDVFNKLGAAQLSTSTSASQSSVVSSMRSLASSISTMSDALDGLTTQADQQVSASVTNASALIKQIFDYNRLIKAATLQGDGNTTYLDQRDTALQNLAQQMDIRVSSQADGTLQVTTQDGIGLVGSNDYAKLNYVPGANGVFGTISAQDTSGATGLPIGTPTALDGHLSSGKMRALIDLRDNTIAGIRNELGSFAKGVASAFNEVHNESSASPPPTTLTGRNTGLLGTDSLNFTGQTRIALTDASGAKLHTVDIDFDAGPPTITVDGGWSTSFSNDIGDFSANLNTALQQVGGSADFSNGVLSLHGGTSGVVVGDPDSTHPSSRAGTGFSQFFGLNDLFTTSVPSISNTGMSTSDQLNLAANGKISFQLKNPNGSVATTVSVAVAAGDSVGTVLTSINAALTGYANLWLDANGAVQTTINGNYTGYTLDVTDDSTLRGSTGVSVSDLFGLGANALGSIASGFKVNADIAASPSRMAFAKPDLSNGATQIVGPGDSRGLIALQNLGTTKVGFDTAGNLVAQTASVQSYAASFYQDIATQSAATATARTTQDDRLSEAKSRLTADSGVNLDEELSNMIMYQKAYSAGARLLTTVNQLYDTLLNMQ